MARRFSMSLLALVFLAAPALAQEAPTTSGSADYRVGPNDVFEVEVLNEPELKRLVQVAADGTVSLGYIGTIPVEGLTAKQIKEKIELLYLKGEFLNNPQVFVTIKEFKSQVIQIFGGVRTPGQHRLTGPSRILDILGQAGGITDNGSTRVQMLRLTEKGEYETVEIDVQKLLAGDTTQNREVRGNDVLFVPRADEVYVLGEVKNPGAVKFEEGLTLTQAISKVAGFTRIASYRVQVVRVEPNGKRTYDINVGKIQGGKDKDFLLRASDLIVVPESYF